MLQVAGDFTQLSHWHDNDYLISAALNENTSEIGGVNALETYLREEIVYESKLGLSKT